MSLAADLAAYLAANVTGLTWAPTGTGGNVFVGWMPDTPDLAVMLSEQAGPESSAGHPYDTPTVQAIVRGSRDPEPGYGIARAVYGALHGLRAVTLSGGTRVVLCRATTSGPVDMGRDEKHRHEWSLTFALEVRSDTSHRT